MTKRRARKPSPKKRINGRVIHSDFELSKYNEAKGLLPKGATITYETEVLDYYTKATYRPDLILESKDGYKIYVETKGYFKYADRVKMINVREANPDLDIRLLFQRNSPSCLGKGSKMRPSEWAEKNGFKFAIGTFPLEWIEDLKGVK